jgi:hypothetical protein
MMILYIIFSLFTASAVVPPSITGPAAPAVAAKAVELKPYVSKANNLDGEATLLFPKTYDLARAAFREGCAPLVTDRKAILGAYKVPSRMPNQDLTIDHIFIPAKEKSDKLVVVTSGIHGAEAYAGHAMQMSLIKDIIDHPENYPFNILILHGLNPFGFKYFRRANENNIDLNRNFASPEQFKAENKSYKKLRRLFNPKGPANATWISQGQFYLSALWSSMIRGRKTILNALSGQYQDSTGPFYGGNVPQTETIFAQFIIKKYGAFASKIYHIDLHTGFGEKNRLNLIAPAEAVKTQSGYYLKIFDGFHVNTGDDKDFYPTTGDITDWTRTSFPDKVVIAVTFEMGTMDSQTTMGGVRSLWTTVVENQAHNYGYTSKQSAIIGRENYEELFFPQDRQWQDAATSQAKDVFEKTLARFKAI